MKLTCKWECNWKMPNTVETSKIFGQYSVNNTSHFWLNRASQTIWTHIGSDGTVEQHYLTTLGVWLPNRLNANTHTLKHRTHTHIHPNIHTQTCFSANAFVDIYKMGLTEIYVHSMYECMCVSRTLPTTSNETGVLDWIVRKLLLICQNHTILTEMQKIGQNCQPIEL